MTIQKIKNEHVLHELQAHVLCITLNRVHKHNAFDDELLLSLQHILDEAQENKHVRVVVLKANGQHFSAGADLNWMQKMVHYSEDENMKDACVLARLMYTLHHFPKPIIAMAQGAAIGGGAGLLAAADITIAGESSRFCFSEVKLGLIPAVISPYVVKAIGERMALWLFTSAETFNAERAKELGLVHYVIPDPELLEYTLKFAHQMATLAPNAIADCKSLVRHVANRPIDNEIVAYTASLIAKKRISIEGQKGLQAFLNKETPNWD